MKVSESIECVVELLQSEEDMLGLMLSEQEKCKRLNQPIDPTSHESTELLLEDYNRQLNGILHDITFLQKRVQTKQELAAIGLDAYRNRMIRMNVQLAVGSVCLSTMTVVAGFFGMNLVSGLENSESMFFLTVGGSAAASTVLYGSEQAKRASLDEDTEATGVSIHYSTNPLNSFGLASLVLLLLH